MNQHNQIQENLNKENLNEGKQDYNMKYKIYLFVVIISELFFIQYGYYDINLILFVVYTIIFLISIIIPIMYILGHKFENYETKLFYLTIFFSLILGILFIILLFSKPNKEEEKKENKKSSPMNMTKGGVNNNPISPIFETLFGIHNQKNEFKMNSLGDDLENVKKLLDGQQNFMKYLQKSTLTNFTNVWSSVQNEYSKMYMFLGSIVNYIDDIFSIFEDNIKALEYLKSAIGTVPKEINKTGKEIRNFFEGKDF